LMVALRLPGGKKTKSNSLRSRPHPPSGHLAPRPGPAQRAGRSGVREPMARKPHAFTPQAGEGLAHADRRPGRHPRHRRGYDSPMDTFTLHRGTAPLLVSVPHDGTRVPPDIASRLSESARRVPDTDWHI